MNYNPELRFSRQVNYPDLAWNIHALVYAYKLNDNYEAIEGLLALDVAYRNESNTYEKFSTPAMQISIVQFIFCYSL